MSEINKDTIVKQEEELLDAAWFRRDELPVIPYPGSVAYNLIQGYFGKD